MKLDFVVIKKRRPSQEKRIGNTIIGVIKFVVTVFFTSAWEMLLSICNMASSLILLMEGSLFMKKLTGINKNDNDQEINIVR